MDIIDDFEHLFKRKSGFLLSLLITQCIWSEKSSENLVFQLTEKCFATHEM